MLSTDAAAQEAMRAAAPPGWEMTQACSLEALGEFQDLLLQRFVLLDLDASEFDPVETVAQIRSEMMLNVPILCFGGDRPRRDAARLARADRFFERADIAIMLPRFCEQFGW
ncbi:MAG TPA: hypothetical protein VNF69_09850 [Burkholderiales bacterium]|nr:hypothetical protein [Burkholderiales bacterium]